MTLVLWAGLAYLLGGIPTSYVAAKIGAGIDLREHGSRSLGATNLFRVLGWRYAIPVGLFDVAKGTVPVLLFAPRAGSSPWVAVVTGTAAILGHVFCPFLGFQGGKGVATAAGVVLGLAPLPFFLAAAVWGTVLWVTGYVSVASMTAAIGFPPIQ